MSNAIARGARIYLPGRSLKNGQALVDQLAATVRRSSTAYTPEFAEKHGMREWVFVLLAYRWPKEKRASRGGRRGGRIEQLTLPL